MNEKRLREPDYEFRERLLRGARVGLLLSLLPWVLSIFFRSRESARFLIQLGVGVLVAIVAVRYFQRRVVVRAPARFTESRSMPVRALTKFALDYGAFLAAFYAFLGTLGLFGIIDHFVQ